MASEIRVNKIENRSGLGTVTFADTGVDLAGIVTATTFSGSGASLTSLPAANITGTLQAISGANLTNLPAANLTGALPAISGANLTGIAATDNVRTGILDVAGISTFRNIVNISNDIKSSDDDFFVYSYKGGTDGQVRSGIQFDSTNQRMEFYTGTNERMRIETGGDLKFNSGFGSVATAFGVRAWVSFNGGGTPAIRGDGGVSSVGDNDTGDYTVNFDSNMPDINYAVGGLSENWEGTNNDSYTQISGYTDGAVVGSYRFVTLRSRFDQHPPQKQDPPFVQLIFVR